MNDGRPLLADEEDLEDTSCGIEMTDSDRKGSAAAPEELIPYSEYADAMRAKNSSNTSNDQNAV